MLTFQLIGLVMACLFLGPMVTANHRDQGI
jgi:hypothetical protein